MEEAYEQWLKLHRTSRKGERLRRLEEGHRNAERLFAQQVWWPAFGQFEHLHPEYEIVDFRDGSRFLDFAYLRPQFHVAIEIDGYGPHWREQSRRQFADQCLRQNHLTIDGWRVMRFSYDDVLERPRLCQQLLQQLFGRRLGEGRIIDATNHLEREIIRLAFRRSNPITPSQVSSHLGMENKYIRKLLRELVRKKWLTPASGTKRVRSYKLTSEGKSLAI